VDLPGVEDLQLDIEGRTLVIKAERKVVHEHTVDFVHNTERSYGKVERKLLLPFNADIDNGSSTYIDGVLMISFPKKETAFNKKLNIEMGERHAIAE
jgi:HSP20 family protein